MTTPKADQEMRDLLIRLDQRVGDGFHNINAKLDEMNRRADGHETRIQSLEHWRTEVKGGAKGLTLGGKLLSGFIGAAITIVTFLGLSVVVTREPPKQATHQIAEQEKPGH